MMAKNQSTRVLNRWKIPGQITDMPKANFKLLNSTYFVEDGSYLRLKDVSLSYNFKGKLLKKWGITRLQPYFTATNLLTWTSYSGMDPEVNQWGNSGTVQGIDWGTYPIADHTCLVLMLNSNERKDYETKNYILRINLRFAIGAFFLFAEL